jgi:hypothetical protein
MLIRDAAKAYLDAGWDIIPYAQGEKGPRDANWTTKAYTIEDFGDTSNIGIRLSTLVDVDCDVKEASTAALKLLPQSQRIHGRPGKPHSHFFFKPDRPVTTIQYRDTDQSMVVELRGISKTGSPAQTMIPPSVHPSGETLRWEVEGELEEISAETIEQRVRAVALVSICARHWPSRGARHEARLALCGYLAKAGASEAAAQLVLDVLTEMTGGLVADVGPVVRDTYAKIAAGDTKVVSSGKLRELLGNDVLKVLNRIIGCEDKAAIDDAVDELNAKHFVIRVGRDELVGTDDREHLVFQTPAAVGFRYENQVIQAGTKKKKNAAGEEVETPVYKTKFDVWRRHPDRREFRTLTFAPPPLIAHPEDYNIWKGFAVEPDASHSCKRMLAHIHDVICSEHTAHAEYLLDLLAFGVQNPGSQSEIATVLRGAQGTGKGLFLRTYGELFGKHFVHLTKKEQLTGKFNEQLSGKCVVFADEAFFAGDPTISGPLKAVITEPTIQIERKGVDQYTETNCIKLFMATNSEWAVPAEFKERRMFVLDVSDAQLQNHDYFEALRDEIDGGGKAAFLACLLARPVDRKRLRKAPATEALHSQQDLSLKPELRWWRECLMTGAIGPYTWPEWIPNAELWRAYLDWCEDLKVMRRATSIELAKRLQPFIRPTTERQLATQRDPEGRPTGAKVQMRGWRMPGLVEARTRFDAKRGSTSRWAPVEDLGDVGQQPGFGVLGRLPGDEVGF